MKIAILGAGFAGMATGFHLLKKNPLCQVHFFDPGAIGSGPSGLSSGLLHSHAGLHARHSWKSSEGIFATLRLLQETEAFLNETIFKTNGVLRPAVTDQHLYDFKECAKKFSYTQWWQKDECKQAVVGLECLGGLFIPDGISINVKKYLNGLFSICQKKGAKHFQLTVTDAKELKEYDAVICALGYATCQVKGFDRLPINPVKGQLIQIKWPESYPPLPYSLVCVGYAGMSEDNKSCMAGATFERGFLNSSPEPSIAIPEIMEKISCFLPFLKDAEIIDCRAGIRASSGQSHLPIVDYVADKLWCITALGSKGLLYHAYLGNCLADAILSNDPLQIPKEVRIKK